MKKLFLLLLALALLLTAGLAHAEAMWVLNTGKWNDRLNLRAQPDKGAPSLGRYYTGTRVEVIEDLGEWMHVSIASGLSGSRTTGYMMRSFLQPVDGTYFAGRMPLETLNRDEMLLDENRVPLHGGALGAGTQVYVMGVSGEMAHVLTMDGRMGYASKSALAGGLTMPTDAQQMIKEVIGVASGGAQLTKDGAPVAALYGGVRLEDAWLYAGREDALVFLGEAKGMIAEDGFTWWDNGANCGCEYPVYVQDGKLVEVLGEMADGRLIVRREDDIALESAAALNGAARLENPDGNATLYYSEPLAGEIGDERAIEIACAKLKQLDDQREWTAAFVVRCVQPQWGRYSLLLVEFVDEQGNVIETVELDRMTGEVIAIGANG